jgi:hypothetical protein
VTIEIAVRRTTKIRVLAVTMIAAEAADVHIPCRSDARHDGLPQNRPVR